MAENLGSNLKQTLTQHKNEKGINLYDHLCNLLQSIDPAETQDKAYTELENISYFLKSNNFEYNKLRPDNEVNAVRDTDPMGTKSVCNKSKAFLNVDLSQS
jgi:hypothetical protein